MIKSARRASKPQTEADKRAKTKYRLATRYVCGGVNADGTALSLDHDHAGPLGNSRGVLCRECNRGLGYFKDRPDLLRRAAGYLRRHCTGCDHG